MVTKSSTSQDTPRGKIPKDVDPSHDADVDSDMVVGDLEPEIEQTTTTNTKAKQDQGSVKSDAIDLVNGIDIHS